MVSENNEKAVRPDEVIWKYNNLIQKVYSDHNLRNLSGLNLEFILNNRPLLQWHHDTINKFDRSKLNDFDYSGNLKDILYFSDEILVFTASLFLFRPFVNDPIKDKQTLNGVAIYPNFKNHYSVRYNMFANIACQSTYNYWDRIGDLIASFFEDRIDSSRVYFTTAIDAIPEMYCDNENFRWLKEFRETKYKELNELRRKTVHYSSIGTSFDIQHSSNAFKEFDSIERLQKEKLGWPEYFKSHIEYSIEGMSQTLQYLDYLSQCLK